MDTMELVKAQEQEMIQMRRHIHQNPELSNQEFQTTKLIQEKLTGYGVEIASGVFAELPERILYGRCALLFERLPAQDGRQDGRNRIAERIGGTSGQSIYGADIGYAVAVDLRGQTL